VFDFTAGTGGQQLQVAFIELQAGILSADDAVRIPLLSSLFTYPIPAVIHLAQWWDRAADLSITLRAPHLAAADGELAPQLACGAQWLLAQHHSSCPWIHMSHLAFSSCSAQSDLAQWGGGDL
jgi:hypothetical protein